MKMSKLTKYIIIIFLFPLISGCGLAYRVLLGVDITPSWNSEKKIIKQAIKYHIPNEYNLVLDTASYYNGLNTIYKNLYNQLNISENDSSEYFNLLQVLKDDRQPVQFRMFDNNGSEIFKLVNCYVDPPIPMNWNINGCFDSFPPKIAVKSLNVHNFDLEFLLSCSSFLNKSKLTFSDLAKTNYYGVIFWNDFFKRPSKKLIKTIKEKFQKTNKPITLIYINNQNAFMWQEMDSTTKEKVKKLDKK